MCNVREILLESSSLASNFRTPGFVTQRRLAITSSGALSGLLVVFFGIDQLYLGLLTKVSDDHTLRVVISIHLER